MTDPEKTVSRMREKHEKRKKKPEKSEKSLDNILEAIGNEEAEGPEGEQLPLWPAATHGVPNSVLRSALFGVIQRGRRRYIDSEPLAALGSLQVTYTGPRLDQADLDVWEQCLSLAKDQGLGNRIEFTARHFLGLIGRTSGKSTHDWLRKALRRLSSSVVDIQDGDLAYFGPLLHGGAVDEETGRYVIEINPHIRALYGDHNYTMIEWQERHALNSQPLAQWLHGFYGSHAKPYPMKTQTIRERCGSETKDLWRFRQALRKALAELSKVTGWECWIDGTDKVNVVRHSR